MIVYYFKDLRWQEIDEDQNPALQYYNDKTEGYRRIDKAIIVCKVASVKTSGVGDGYMVIFVPITGDVIRKGVFWKFKDAELFAESLLLEELNEFTK